MLLRAAVVLLRSLAPAHHVVANGVAAAPAPAGYFTGQPPQARQATETTETKTKIVGARQRPITTADNVRFFCTCLATAIAYLARLRTMLPDV